SGVETSLSFAIASPPRDRMRSATCSAIVESFPNPDTSVPRSFTTTRAPRSARSSTYARPSPRPAPVTTATFPSNEIRSVISLSSSDKIQRPWGGLGFFGHWTDCLRDLLGQEAAGIDGDHRPFVAGLGELVVENVDSHDHRAHSRSNLHCRESDAAAPVHGNPLRPIADVHGPRWDGRHLMPPIRPTGGRAARQRQRAEGYGALPKLALYGAYLLGVTETRQPRRHARRL